MRNSRLAILKLFIMILITILPGILALTSQALPYMKDFLSECFYASIIAPLLLFIYDILVFFKMKHEGHLTHDLEGPFRLDGGI